MPTERETYEATLKMFMDNPKSHTQGAYARNSFQQMCTVDDEDAKSFCLLGGLLKNRPGVSVLEDNYPWLYDTAEKQDQYLCKTPMVLNDKFGYRAVVFLLRETLERMNGQA